MITTITPEELTVFEEWKRNHPDQEAIRELELLSLEIYAALKQMCDHAEAYRAVTRDSKDGINRGELKTVPVDEFKLIDSGTINIGDFPEEEVERLISNPVFKNAKPSRLIAGRDRPSEGKGR